MPARRNVKQNSSGGWDILKEGDRRALVSADTQKHAVEKARAQLRREGGGEVRVLDRTGKIVSARAVTAARPKAA